MPCIFWFTMVQLSQLHVHAFIVFLFWLFICKFVWSGVCMMARPCSVVFRPYHFACLFVDICLIYKMRSNVLFLSCLWVCLFIRMFFLCDAKIWHNTYAFYLLMHDGTTTAITYSCSHCLFLFDCSANFHLSVRFQLNAARGRDYVLLGINFCLFHSCPLLPVTL